MTSAPGSVRAIAKELLRIYGLRLTVWLPLIVTAVVGVATGLLCPNNLANSSTHDDWKDMFTAAAGVIAALVVAIVVEARTPFSRGGGRAAGIAAVSGTLLLGCAGVAAVIGLVPSLSNFLYRVLVALTIGGVVGGFTAVVLLGINVTLGRLRQIDESLLKRLKELGQPSEAEELFREAGL